MNQHYSATRKIDPKHGTHLPDGSPNNADRIEIGPTQLAFGEWEAAGLTLPNLQDMREYRWKRLTRHIVDRGYGGLLMFDPLNIRYATDSTNMQLWNTHNPFRAVLLCADGYMVIWDYKNSPFLSEFNPLVRERRSGADLFYFDRGDKIDIAADKLDQQFDNARTSASADVVAVHMDVLADAADTGARMEIDVMGTTYSFARQANGNKKLVTIHLDEKVSAASVFFRNLNRNGDLRTNDGFSLDDVALSTVPLPASALLLLGGIGGLAAFGRRRRG